MKFHTPVLLTTLLLSACSQPEKREVELVQSPHYSSEKQAQYEREYTEIVKIFRTETGYEEIDRGEVLQFIDRKNARVFLVTKPGHPAHPAVVTRQAVEQDGYLFLKSSGIGRGDKNALKIWIDYLDSEAKIAIDRDQEASEQ